LIAQHHQNQILSGRIDNAEQNQRAMSGGGYTAVSIIPSENAVYLPLAKLKLADSRLNEQLVYNYQDARPSPDSKKTFPAEVDISTHDLSVSDFASAQFDCSQVVYADFVTPSYPVNPTWKSDGNVALADGRTMNVYYAPNIKGCGQTWAMNKIDPKAIADSLKQAVCY
jgi:hypothetical protein